MKNVNLTDVQNHVMKIRSIIMDLETWIKPGMADQLIIEADTVRDLLQCAATWCDITEAVWLGKGEEKH